MDTILISIAVILGVLVALFAIPIDLVFNINRVSQNDGLLHGQVKVRWLFGLLNFRINVPDKQAPHKGLERNKSDNKKKSKADRKSADTSQLIKLLKQSPFRRRLFKFVKDLLRASHYHDLFLRLRIGVGDPAETGQLWILLGPLAVMARHLRGATVRIEPEFIDPVFDVRSHGKFRIIPLELLLLVIGFVLSPASIRGWHSLRDQPAT